MIPEIGAAAIEAFAVTVLSQRPHEHCGRVCPKRTFIRRGQPALTTTALLMGAAGLGLLFS